MDSIPTAHLARPSVYPTARLRQWIEVHLGVQTVCHGPLWTCTRGHRRRGFQPGRVMVMARSAAMRSSSGGWVLKNEENIEPPPNSGRTMQSAEVVSGI